MHTHGARLMYNCIRNFVHISRGVRPARSGKVSGNEREREKRVSATRRKKIKMQKCIVAFKKYIMGLPPRPTGRWYLHSHHVFSHGHCHWNQSCLSTHHHRINSTPESNKLGTRNLGGVYFRTSHFLVSSRLFTLVFGCCLTRNF